LATQYAEGWQCNTPNGGRVITPKAGNAIRRMVAAYYAEGWQCNTPNGGRVLRRRRWLIAAQGSSVSENPGLVVSSFVTTLKGLAAHMPNPFRIQRRVLLIDPRVVAALQPWAEISERLRRFISK
jgi:hypothetical protein